MNNIKLSSINFRDFEIKDASEGIGMTYLAKSAISTYEAAYYVAKALGFKNVSEMEQVLYPNYS